MRDFKDKQQTGMTLVEMLAALIVIGVISVVTTRLVQTGLKVYQRAAGPGGWVRQVFLLERAVQEDLDHLTASPISQGGRSNDVLFGRRHSFQFFRETDRGLQEVTYALKVLPSAERHETRRGETHSQNGSLLMRWSEREGRFSLVREERDWPFSKDEPVRRDVFLTGLFPDDGQMRYQGLAATEAAKDLFPSGSPGQEWASSWEGRGVPCRVRFIIKTPEPGHSVWIQDWDVPAGCV